MAVLPLLAAALAFRAAPLSSRRGQASRTSLLAMNDGPSDKEWEEVGPKIITDKAKDLAERLSKQQKEMDEVAKLLGKAGGHSRTLTLLTLCSWSMS